MKNFGLIVFGLVVMAQQGVVGQMVVSDPGSYTYLATQATNAVSTVQKLNDSYELAQKSIDKVEKVSNAITQGKLVLNMINDLEGLTDDLVALPELAKNISNKTVRGKAGERILGVKEDIALTANLLTEAITSGKLNGEDFQRMEFLLSLSKKIDEIGSDINNLNYILRSAQPRALKWQ